MSQMKIQTIALGLLFGAVGAFAQDPTSVNGRNSQSGPALSASQNPNCPRNLKSDRNMDCVRNSDNVRNSDCGRDPEAIKLHREKIDQAIVNRDYDAWKAERDNFGSRGPNSEKVSRENFETFAAMREAQQKGDTATAQKLRAELGFTQGKGFCGGKGKGMGMGQKKGKGGKGQCGRK